MLQDPSQASALQANVIAPLAEAQQLRRTTIASKAAATKVQFFAMRNMRA
jgi:alpha-D-ribose 1-methylphosphonate 5-triphosphate synthase subunit PhnG